MNASIQDSIPKREIPVIADHCAEILRLASGRAVRLVFDVGANIGSTVLNYLRCFESARVIAFEPVGSTYTRLISKVGASSRVCCMNLALGPEPGECLVHHQRYSALNSLHGPINVPEPACPKSELVQVTTLDEIVRLNQTEHIDLLKLDTEHFELEILRGAARTLAEERISFIYSEVTFNLGDERHTHYAELSDYLENYGFHAVGFSEHIFDGEPGRVDHCNALFAHRHLPAPRPN